MSEVKFKFTGKKGIIALAIIIAIVLLRLGTIGESHDPKLRDTIRTELMNKLGGRTSQALSNLDKSDSDAVLALAERADPAGIKVHSMRTSRPLLSFASKERVIVLVEYSLPRSPKRVEYWRFEYSPIGGWRYWHPSTVISYYLNFL